MPRIRPVLVAVLAGGLAAAGILSPISAAADPPPPPIYLSLGDSLASGYPTGIGYANKLATTLQVTEPGLRLVKLGCPGETTATMINGNGPCTGRSMYQKFGGATSQLAAARWILQHDQGAVRYLTIDIGADDILPCISSEKIDTACLTAGFQTLHVNLPIIMGGLRTDLGPQAEAAGMTFYDPFLAFLMTDRQVALQSLVVLNGLNLLESANYARAGFRTAPVADAFETNDLRLDPTTMTPVNTERICGLTRMCPPPPGTPDIHPNRDGYQLIADTFAGAFHLH